MLTLYRDKLFQRHETGNHPECPERLAAIDAMLESSGLLERTRAGELRRANVEELTRLHTADHVARIERAANGGGGRLDPDTVVSPESFEVARTAAGVAMAAVDQVLSGEDRTAAALTRPPGHHARPAQAMGFCLFNNVALAALHARQAHGLERVLIVDFDVHHGNGTQDAFYEDQHVHFFSAHRYPFYPGTGDDDETGSGAGAGTIWNLPLAFGISRADYRAAFERMLTDAADRCRPELVLLSAGFDAHRADPIGSLGLENEDFHTLTALVCEVATAECEGRIVSLLEGGYNLQVLPESVHSHLEALIEHDAQHSER